MEGALVYIQRVSRVRHSVAINDQLFLFYDQSMRENAWRSRTLLAGAAGELAGATRLRLAASQTFERMHILCVLVTEAWYSYDLYI